MNAKCANDRLSQWKGSENRSTAIFRNALGYRPITRFFATRSFLSLQSVPIASVSFDGFSPTCSGGIHGQEDERDGSHGSFEPRSYGVAP
jgi:hypothetical protein